MLPHHKYVSSQKNTVCHGKKKKTVTEKVLLVDQTNGYQNANVIGWKYLH